MNEPHVRGTRQTYLQLDNALQFRLSRIRETEDFLITEINDSKDEQVT